MSSEFKPKIVRSNRGEAAIVSEHSLAVVPSAESVVLGAHMPRYSHFSDILHHSLNEVIQNYLQYYAAGESHTARAKRYDLMHFLDFLEGEYGSEQSIPVSAWTKQSTEDFLEFRFSEGDSPSTVSRRLATLKHLGRTLSDRIPEFVHPAREVKSPKFDLQKPQGLSAEELLVLQKVIQEDLAAHPEHFEKHRNALLFEMLALTGLRADEVRLLQVQQVSEDREWLHKVRTKGKRFREVYIPHELRASLSRHLEWARRIVEERVPLSRDWDDAQWRELPVLVSPHRADANKPATFALAPKPLWRVISGFSELYAQSEEAYRSLHLHPHKLRHTFAHGLLNSSKDIRIVAQALGHSDVRTTMRYTERDKEELARAIERSRSNHE